MCEPVEECCCHLCVTKDLRPLTEAEVGRDDDAGALIEFAEKVEQQRAATGTERQNPRSGLLQPADAGVGGSETKAEIHLRNPGNLFRQTEPPLTSKLYKIANNQTTKSKKLASLEPY